MKKFTIEPTVIETLYVQAANEEVLSVTAEIKNSDGEVVHKIKHAFPLDISKEELTTELQKALDTYERDKELAEISAAYEAKHKNAQLLADELVGEKL